MNARPLRALALLAFAACAVAQTPSTTKSPTSTTSTSPSTPSTPARADSTAARSGLDCMIQPHQVVQIGAAAAGVIEHILVDRGDVVSFGQTVVRMQSGVERAALAVARERATQEGDMKVAAGSAQLAQRELARAQELHAEKFVSQTYLDKQRAEAHVASGRTEQASERKRLAHREVQLASAQLAQRSIASPIDGVVVERFMSPGEFVDQKPILRLAATNPLRVDVLVPAVAFGRITPGMKGAVTPELLDTRVHEAVVKTVDRVIDAATNTFRVRLEMPNPNHALPAGLRCRVDLGIKLVDTVSGAATPGATAAALPAGATPGAVIASR